MIPPIVANISNNKTRQRITVPLRCTLSVSARARCAGLGVGFNLLMALPLDYINLARDLAGYIGIGCHLDSKDWRSMGPIIGYFLCALCY